MKNIPQRIYRGYLESDYTCPPFQGRKHSYFMFIEFFQSICKPSKHL